MILVENEFKVLLDKESFNKILALNKHSDYKSQINHYFDTDEFTLYKNGCTLRIRIEEDKILGCLKSKSLKESLIKSSFEYSFSVNQQNLNNLKENSQNIGSFISKDIIGLLESVNTKPTEIKYIGMIENNRTKLNYLDHNTFELDHTLFFGEISSYELEVENVVSNEECLRIIHTLNNLECNYEITNYSKYQRFINLYKNRRLSL